MMPPFVVFPTNRIAHFVEVSLYLFYLAQQVKLYVENYLVFTKRPYELVGVVKKLRLQGIAIDLCKEERIKRADLLKKKETFACNSDIQKIVDYYSEKPTDFEGLCSELFESFFE